MKIRCDVCDRQEASVFCSADEAALCDGCDQRVHHANKLAGKHPRFSLLQPAFKESPLCDICRERRAFLFCQEDRAILCRECDIPIHTANEHTRKHNRFLLTGVKLSASSSLHQSPSVAAAASAAEISSSAAAAGEMSTLASTSDNGSYSTSSISEYLMETLPGWHVEDFLEPSSFASNGFCKTNSKSQAMPFVNNDNDDNEFESNKSSLSFSSSEDFGNNYLPQNLPHITTFYPSNSGVFGAVKAEDKDIMVNRNWDDICCTVPYITPPTSKRQRQHFQ